MSQISKIYGNFSKGKFILIFVILAAALITGVAYAQVGDLTIDIKAGDPTELVADGSSQTRLMFDLSGCVWYSGAKAKDELQIDFTSSLGTSLSPPSVYKVVEKVGSPFEVTLKAGTQYGTAKVTASAAFCTQGNVMLAGKCSSKEEKDTPRCTGEFEITIRPADSGSEEGETEEESEETGDLSVSISCPPNPKVGSSVTCTASVSGAKKDESLEYVWSLEGAAGSETKNSTYTWKGDQAGYYEVSVAVFGQEDRSAKKFLRVEVFESETSEDEEKTGDSTSTVSSGDSNLVSSLKSFLKAAGVKNINPARLAVAGTGVATLIAIWMIINQRAGVPKEKLEQAVGQWRWREGQKVPKPPSKGGEKPSELPEKPSQKPSQNLPEGLKSEKAASPPVTLPEEKAVDQGAQASDSAQLDDPSQAEPAAASPPPGKAVSGETWEERAERFVDDTEDNRDAVDKTLAGLKKKLEGVPKPVKDSGFWKQKVAPLLKKFDKLGLESKSAKLKGILRITKELLEVRKKVDADLSYLSKEEREGVVWLERGLQVGEEAVGKIHQQFITDPAIAAAKWGLPKELAAAAEKILKQHQADIQKMLKGIKKLPRKFVEYGTKAQQRNQDVPKIKKALFERTNVEYFDWTKSPKKLLPAIKKVGDAASWAKKQLGRVFISLRDTRPGQK